MNRAACRFRPFLDQFDSKTLLSAGQLAHLVGGVHGAVEDLATKYKFYFKVKNLTGADLGAKVVQWKLVNGDTVYEDKYVKALKKGEETTITSKAIDNSLASVTIVFRGNTYTNVSYISRPADQKEPSNIPVFNLNP